MTKPCSLRFSLLEMVLIAVISSVIGFTFHSRIASYDAHTVPTNKVSAVAPPVVTVDSQWQHPLGGMIIIEDFEGTMHPGTIEELTRAEVAGEIYVEILQVRSVENISISFTTFISLSRFDRWNVLWVGRRHVYG